MGHGLLASGLSACGYDKRAGYPPARAQLETSVRSLGFQPLLLPKLRGSSSTSSSPLTLSRIPSTRASGVSGTGSSSQYGGVHQTPRGIRRSAALLDANFAIGASERV